MYIESVELMLRPLKACAFRGLLRFFKILHRFLLVVVKELAILSAF